MAADAFLVAPNDFQSFGFWIDCMNLFDQPTEFGMLEYNKIANSKVFISWSIISD